MPPRQSLFRAVYLPVLLYAAVVLLPLLGDGTVLSRHEVLAAEPAREMLAGTGSWAVQTFAGEFRTAKPPTMSWLIAGSMALLRSESEFAARLPAALAGIVTALATAHIAHGLSRRATFALLAGLATVTTYWVQMQARLAEADMPLVAAVTIAMAAIVPRASPATHRQALLRSVLFYGATGVGFLLKGVGPLVTLPAALLFAAWARDRDTWRVLRQPIGIATLAILLTAWPVAAYRTNPDILHDWRRQTVDRSLGQLDETERGTTSVAQYLIELPYYLWMIPLLLLPATPVVMIGLWRGLKRPGRWPASARFLTAWVVPFLLLLTLSAWKHKHYILPVLPAFSVAAAYGTLIWAASLKRPQRARGLLIAWFAGVAGVLLIVQAFVLPKFDGYRPHAEFAWQTNALLPAGERATLIGLGEAHVAYYLREIPTRIDDPAAVPADRRLYAVCMADTADLLSRTHPVHFLLEGAPRKKEAQGRRLVLVQIGR